MITSDTKWLKRAKTAAKYILGIWVVFALVFLFGDRTSWGSYGDAFGMLNTLFAGLALAALIITLWMQREEIHLMTEEMSRQAEAQEKQVTALGEQKEKMQQQLDVARQDSVEARIFRILELRQRLIEGTEYAERTSALGNQATYVTHRGWRALEEAIRPSEKNPNASNPTKVLIDIGYEQAFELLCDAVELATTLGDQGQALLLVIRNHVTHYERKCVGILLAGREEESERHTRVTALLKS